MQPQHDGILQDRQVADTTGAAFLHIGALRLTAWTHERASFAFEMYVEIPRADDLVQDTEFG